MQAEARLVFCKFIFVQSHPQYPPPNVFPLLPRKNESTPFINDYPIDNFWQASSVISTV